MQCQKLWHVHVYVQQETVVGKDGRIHQLKQFKNYGTEYVMYTILCPCGHLYVGRISRTVRVRIGEHKCCIINLRDKYPVPRHFQEAYQGDPSGMRVFGIELI